MSTLKVNKIEATGTTDGGIEIDSDGHVQIDGVHWPTAGPLSNRNLIINGAMQVAQRGTSFTASGYGVDRWQTQFPASVGITHTQETLSSGDPYNEGFRYFMRADVTTASTASDRWTQFTTRLEAQTLAQSGWKYTDTNSYITISFWARSSLSGTYYLVLRASDAASYTYPKSFTLEGDTWKKITCSIPGNSNLVFDNDALSGLEILVKPDYGPDFTGSEATDNAWYNRTTQNWVPDYSQNWLATVDNTFDLTGVQLEVGDKATPFEHRIFGDELSRCQRYYSKSYSYQDAPGTNTSDSLQGLRNWDASDRSDVPANVRFPVEMRAAPTVTIYTRDGSSGNLSESSNGFTHGSSKAISSVRSLGRAGYNTLACSVNVGGLQFYIWHWTASAEL